eukprot:8854741-Alexandrium_andersonii.AAC.1
MYEASTGWRRGLGCCRARPSRTAGLSDAGALRPPPPQVTRRGRETTRHLFERACAGGGPAG